MFDFFKSKSVLDEDSIIWLFDTFLWAENFLDADIFYKQTLLVLPSNAFFPAKSNDLEEMSTLIFANVKQYAHLQHWPFQLVNQNNEVVEQVQLPYIEGAIRGTKVIDQSSKAENSLLIPFNPIQSRNPQAIIAYFAQTLAYYALLLSPNKPENYQGNIPQLSEVIAVFMGFGVIMANSAFNYKNVTCGSCNTPSTERQSYLSQYDITYALAIFCVLKGINKKVVLASLKSSLRTFFKKAYKQVLKRAELERFNSVT